MSPNHHVKYLASCLDWDWACKCMIEGIHFWIDECEIFLKYIQLGNFKSKIVDLTDTDIEMIKFILHFTLIFRRRET